ncbi:MAG TPA: DUF2760 domain-containing protein [Terracidiphilus sp.]|jgi:hypothetical protein
MIGVWERVVLSFRCSLSILFRSAIPDDIAQKLLKPTVPVQQEPVAPAPAPSRLREAERPASDTFDRAVQMLALLQRDGRLVDFLFEDISTYPDLQLGGAVRSIHGLCRKVLNLYIELEPILNFEEDQPVTVEADFDPSAIKLIGNVAGEPPVRGILRHKGWRVKAVNMPPLPQAAGRLVIAPAEVELP